MNWKLFSINEFGIRFKYPSALKIGIEDNTYLFYNEYLGSFRITPVKIENTTFDIDKFLSNEFAENSEYNPNWVNFGLLKFLSYKKHSTEDNSIIHFFNSGKGKLLILCSFAYDTSRENSPEINGEIENIKIILSSIELL